MWGPWATGMASAELALRLERLGLQVFDPKAGLVVLEAALGVKRAELVVASFVWKQFTNSPMYKMAIFAGISHRGGHNMLKTAVQVIILLCCLHTYQTLIMHFRLIFYATHLFMSML